MLISIEGSVRSQRAKAQIINETMSRKWMDKYQYRSYFKVSGTRNIGRYCY